MEQELPEFIARAQQHAKASGLIYVSDSEPGIARTRRGRGFLYLAADRRPLKSEHVLDRIRHQTLSAVAGTTAISICRRRRQASAHRLRTSIPSFSWRGAPVPRRVMYRKGRCRRANSKDWRWRFCASTPHPEFRVSVAPDQRGLISYPLSLKMRAHNGRRADLFSGNKKLALWQRRKNRLRPESRGGWR